jgi:HAE1 family hydrophobic/amphiphilic exporter-1
VPDASSLQRTDEVCRKIEAPENTPGVQYATTVVGFSLLSTASTTYNAFFFVTPNRTNVPSPKKSPRFSRTSMPLAQLPEAKAFFFRRQPFPASAPQAVTSF